jgi:hypothetical protein
MIPKRLDNVTEDDLLALIRDELAEGRTIDYKRELPGNSDGDKKEFLADVSSFANTAGGDLIFGVDEDQGLPTQITGFQSADIDLELRRLESLLASGLDPRIRYAARVITCSIGQKILIIRTERSWTAPHRVIFKGHDKFYGRNATGKYPLDVNELRVAFTLSSTATERIRAFRTDRIIAVSNNQTPVPFAEEPKIVLHCMPLESFAGQPQYDLPSFYGKDAAKYLWTIPRAGWSYQFNLEGLVAFDGHDNYPSESYTQLYRNGVIEAVSVIAREYQGKLMIPSGAYEKLILDYLPSCFHLLRELGASVPIVVALALTNTRGLRMGVDLFRAGGGHDIEQDTVILPETIVHEFSQPANKILKPMFDIVWNACGYASSMNFGPEGNWIRRN